jgi:hypothetical protein
MGYRFDPDPNAVRPVSFAEEICRSDYIEYWSDELQIFHNPKAKNPLHESVFSGVTQHFFRDGKQMSIIPEGTVLASRTMIMQLVGDVQKRDVI